MRGSTACTFKSPALMLGFCTMHGAGSYVAIEVVIR